MYWILIFFILLTACEEPTQKTDFKPDPVQLVLRSAGADTLESEPGIDAVPTGEGEINHIQIQWYRHPQIRQIEKFNIYRSEDPDGLKSYRLIGSVAAGLSGKPDSIYFDTQDLRLNVRYYYYVTAVSNDLVESEPSDTVSYRLLEKAVGLTLNGNEAVITQPVLDFQWWMASGSTPDVYVLRIERLLGGDAHPLELIRLIRSTYQTPQTFHLEGAQLQEILTDGEYRWRIDCMGREDVENQYFEGSESNWKIFKVKWGS